MKYGNGRREVALLSIDPIRQNLLSELLRAHGQTGRFFPDRKGMEVWLRGEGAGCSLLIAEVEPDGCIPAWIGELKSALPNAIHVLPLPGIPRDPREAKATASFKPSELFRNLECALAATGAGTGRP